MRPWPVGGGGASSQVVGQLDGDDLVYLASWGPATSLYNETLFRCGEGGSPGARLSTSRPGWLDGTPATAAAPCDATTCHSVPAHPTGPRTVHWQWTRHAPAFPLRSMWLCACVCVRAWRRRVMDEALSRAAGSPLALSPDQLLDLARCCAAVMGRDEAHYSQVGRRARWRAWGARGTLERCRVWRGARWGRGRREDWDARRQLGGGTGQGIWNRRAEGALRQHSPLAGSGRVHARGRVHRLGRDLTVVSCARACCLPPPLPPDRATQVQQQVLKAVNAAHLHVELEEMSTHCGATTPDAGLQK